MEWYEAHYIFSCFESLLSKNDVLREYYHGNLEDFSKHSCTVKQFDDKMWNFHDSMQWSFYQMYYSGGRIRADYIGGVGYGYIVRNMPHIQSVVVNRRSEIVLRTQSNAPIILMQGKQTDGFGHIIDKR